MMVPIQLLMYIPNFQPTPSICHLVSTSSLHFMLINSSSTLTMTQSFSRIVNSPDLDPSSLRMVYWNWKSIAYWTNGRLVADIDTWCVGRVTAPNSTPGNLDARCKNAGPSTSGKVLLKDRSGLFIILIFTRGVQGTRCWFLLILLMNFSSWVYCTIIVLYRFTFQWWGEWKHDHVFLTFTSTCLLRHESHYRLYIPIPQ